MLTKPQTTELLTFLATHEFHKPATRDGLDGATDAVLIYEDDENESLWVFDPEAEGGPRLEQHNESAYPPVWNITIEEE